MATKQPIEPSAIQRAIQGVRYAITGKQPDWFGPGQPIAPQAQAEADQGGARGRQFDFPVGVNINRTPKGEQASGGAGVSFGMLRTLADSYDLMRLAIETRKDQVAKLQWTFGPIDEKKQVDSRCEELKDFFRMPDGEHDWDTWLRALLEDLLVIDAPCLYPRPNLAGGVHSFELLDGGTIKRVLDQFGRTPEAPDPAYQQILKGMPAVDYSRDELIYKPRNVRTNRIYGYSPVEQVVMTVNIALRRQVSQLQYYTEGNVPEAIIGVPVEWNVDQIAAFQKYWDSMLEGDTAERRHAKFVPGGLSYTPTRDPKLKDEYDDWLARIICYAFSVSPQALIKEMNRATAESAMKQAQSEGLMPIMNWVRSLINFLVWKYFGYTDLEFKWAEEDSQSPKEQADTVVVLVNGKVITKNEGRDMLGLEPMTPEQEAELAPPPPPALGLPVGQIGPPGAKQDPPDPTPDPKDPKAAPEVAGKLGKAQATSLRKASALPISRVRPGKTAVEAALLKTVTEHLSKASRSAADAAAEALADTSKGTTDQVKRILAAMDIDLSALEPDLVEILEDLLKEAGVLGLEQVLTEATDKMLSQVNEFAVDYAEARAAHLVKGLEEATEDMLRSTIVQSIEGGWAPKELADAIQDSYGFSAERSLVIARTEAAYADVQGNLEGWRASGVVAGKRWIVDPSESCDACSELDGTEVDLDDEFPNDGGDGPPLHPNCECDVVPILKED